MGVGMNDAFMWRGLYSFVKGVRLWWRRAVSWGGLDVYGWGRELSVLYVVGETECLIYGEGESKCLYVPPPTL